MTEGARFEDTLGRLVSVLERARVPYAVIGGLAVAAWGVPRATEDIDLLADATPTSANLDLALRQAGFEPEWHRGGPDDPVPLLLRLRDATGGPEVDVVCVTRQWEQELLQRAVTVRVPGGPEVRVVSVEDLIVLKLLAGGPGDLADVADLLSRSGPLPTLEERAAARGVAPLFRRVREALG